MKKNDIVVGVCNDYTHEGLGVVKVDGFPFFVRGALRNEKITFKIISMKKSFGYGLLLKIEEESKARVAPFCLYFNKCGGCQLQHMNDCEQAHFKQGLVENNIQRIGKSNATIKPVLSYSEKHYRNKGQFPLTSEPSFAMGFYRAHSNDLVAIDECPIQSERINQLFKLLKDILPNYSATKQLRHVLIKHAFKSDELMLVFIANKDISKQLNDVINEVLNKIEITSIVLNINTKNNNVILGDEEVLLHGEKQIEEQLLDYKFMISSKSFYQINPRQTEVLYNQVLEFANLTKQDSVLELYCGVGSISLFLANQAKKVVGIEIVDAAIENAKANARLNNIENVEFVCSDAGSYAKSVVDNNQHFDVVVVDPPRKGCDDTTINSIVSIEPNRIIYVSCNPATLARDINKFEQFGYQADIVQPVDMFPYTYHVECVCLMSKINIT